MCQAFRDKEHDSVLRDIIPQSKNPAVQMLCEKPPLMNPQQ